MKSETGVDEAQAVEEAVMKAKAAQEAVGESLDDPLIMQDDIDELMRIHGFIQETTERHSRLIDEICSAILDSGRLTLQEWRSLRDGLAEIEELIPHIDLIIKLKAKAR